MNRLRAFVTVLALALLLTAFESRVRAAEREVPLWGRFETQVLNAKRYANPFRDVVLNATFTSPSGRTVKFFGFHDGDGKGGQTGTVWKLRFMPDEVGTWSFTCSFSDGTPATSGSLPCVKVGARPGPLRADPANPRYWVHADGTRFSARGFYAADLFYIAEDRSRTDAIDRFFGRQYQFNLCSTTFLQGPYLHDKGWLAKWPAAGAEKEHLAFTFNGFFPFTYSGMTPLGNGSNVDYARPNIKWMGHVDKVLRELEARGAVWYNFDGLIGAHWGSDFKMTVPVEAEEQWLRYFIARFGPYWNVLWNVAGEWDDYLTPARLDGIGHFIRQADPWRHPLSTHSGRIAPDRPWMDYRIEQYMAGGGRDGSGADAAGNAKRISSHYAGKPHFASEVAWEGLREEEKLNAEQVRTGAWGILMGGGFYLYAEHFKTRAGGEGVVGDGGALPYVEIMNDFLYGREYWKRSPAPALVNAGSLCLAVPGQEYVVYRQTGGTIALDLSAASGKFAAAWLNPRTGTTRPAGNVTGGAKRTFHCPDEHDWVLHLWASPKRSKGVKP